MKNIKVLITSGGTKIPIDSVRSITNMSRGTFGSKIAAETDLLSIHNNHNIYIDFLYAKESRCPFSLNTENHRSHEYVTFWDYARELDILLQKQPDIIILAAAVSDYEVENVVDGKIRTKEDLVIRLKPLPKLISTVREKCPNAVICGFKLLVNSTEEELTTEATKSLISNKLDLVIGNDLRDIKANNHKLVIVEDLYDNITVQRYSSKNYNLAYVVIKQCLELHNIKQW